MDNFKLKILALTSMLIDHIGYVFFPQALILRFVGRLAFPIYAFLLVQGYEHTKESIKFKKYFARMILFAFISEISFDLCFFGEPLYLGYQNVYFTLALGLISMALFDKVEEKGKDGFYVIIASIAVSAILHSDYQIIGIIIIFMFFISEKYKKQGKSQNRIIMFQIIIFAFMVLYEFIANSTNLTVKDIIFSFKNYTWVYLATPFSLIPINMYNGKLGYNSKPLKMLFYWFYPLHITIIYIISYLIK